MTFAMRERNKMPNPKDFFGNLIKKEGMSFARAFEGKVVVVIGSALGFVIAFAWKDLMINLFEYFFSSPGASLIAQLIYAIVVTVAGVIALVYLTKLGEWFSDLVKEEEKPEDDDPGSF